MCGGGYAYATLDRNQKRKQSISLDGLKWFNGWGSIETDSPAHRGMCNRVVQKKNMNLEPRHPLLDAIWVKSEARGLPVGVSYFQEEEWFVGFLVFRGRSGLSRWFDSRQSWTVNWGCVTNDFPWLGAFSIFIQLHGHTRKNDNYCLSAWDLCISAVNSGMISDHVLLRFIDQKSPAD